MNIFPRRKLTSHLNSLREKLENKEIPEKELGDVNACIENTAQFLLKLKPNQRTMLIARSTELERKISKLESLIGTGVSSTVSFTIFSDLLFISAFLLIVFISGSFM